MTVTTCKSFKINCRIETAGLLKMTGRHVACESCNTGNDAR